MIREIGKSIDGLVLKGANATVKAWNWTTGETKSGLANKLLTIAPMFEISGLYHQNPFVGIAFGSILLAESHDFQKKFIKSDKKELNALECDALDFLIESNKAKDYRLHGYGWPVVSSINLTTSLVHNKQPECYWTEAIGHFLRGSAFQIMRADYLPPRKNCVSRGIDKLKILAEQYKPKPALGLGLENI